MASVILFVCCCLLTICGISLSTRSLAWSIFSYCGSKALLAVALTHLYLFHPDIQHRNHPNLLTIESKQEAPVQNSQSDWYIGSAIGHTYHDPTCRYCNQISEKHLLYFDTEAEAKNLDKEPCRWCLGDLSSR